MNGLPFSIFWIIFHMNTSWFTYVFYCRGIFELTFHYYECMWCPVNIHVLVCVCVCVLSSTLCDPMDCSPPGSSVDGIFQEKYWNGLPFPPPGNFPELELKPASPVAPELASGFFTTGGMKWKPPSTSKSNWTKSRSQLWPVHHTMQSGPSW